MLELSKMYSLLHFAAVVVDVVIITRGDRVNRSREPYQRINDIYLFEKPKKIARMQL